MKCCRKRFVSHCKSPCRNLAVCIRWTDPKGILDTLSLPQRNTRWQEVLSSSQLRERAYVAEIDHRIAGFCSVGPCRDEDTGELLAIYVDPKHMNLGVGSSLLARGISFLKEQVFEKATLWVLSSNKETIKWYENRDWSADGKTRTEELEEFQLHETRYLVSL